MKKLLLLISALNVLSISAQTQSTLVACYGLNGNATDAVNAINGTTVGTSASNDRFSNASGALNFSGSSSSFVRIPNSSKLKANAMTISLWARPSSTVGSQYIIFTKNSASSNFEAYSIVAGSNGKFVGVVGSAGNVVNVNSTTSYTTGVWYHLALSFSSSGTSLYVNGTAEGTTTLSVGVDYDTTGVILGGSNLSFNLPYAGLIDNMRIYNGVLSATEINQIYTNDAACGAVPTGIKTNGELSETANIFPNPAHDIISVSLDSGAPFRYSVCDLTGKTMLSGKSDHAGNSEILISDLARGVYFITIESGNHHLVKKLIKE